MHELNGEGFVEW